MGEIELKSWYIKILCHPMEFQEFFHLQYFILQKDINGHSSTNNSFSAYCFFFSCVCGGGILNSLSIPKLLTYFKVCIYKEPGNQSMMDSFRKAEETFLTYWNSGQCVCTDPPLHCHQGLRKARPRSKCFGGLSETLVGKHCPSWQALNQQHIEVTAETGTP